MSITANDGGVLRKLGTISANNGGVIRNSSTISANDGGVLRTIFSMKKVEISGITPLVVAEDHIVIVESGTFTLTAPAGARIIVGGAAQGRNGGKVARYTLESPVNGENCSVTLGAVDSGEESNLTIGSQSYSSGNVKQVIWSKWGPVGGEGGYGNSCVLEEGTVVAKSGTSPTGAAGGFGEAYASAKTYAESHLGGNSAGYGNKGAAGGTRSNEGTMNGDTSICGAKGGSYAETSPKGMYGCGGGGGGYSAGGGGGGYCYQSPKPAYGGVGQGGAGIIVIEW